MRSSTILEQALATTDRHRPEDSPINNEGLTTILGDLKAIVLKERALESQYHVAFYTNGKNIADRSYWVQATEMSDDLTTSFDAQLLAVAQLTSNNVQRRTAEKFGRGCSAVLVVIQALAATTLDNMEKYTMHPGGYLELV